MGEVRDEYNMFNNFSTSKQEPKVQQGSNQIFNFNKTPSLQKNFGFETGFNQFNQNQSAPFTFSVFDRNEESEEDEDSTASHGSANFFPNNNYVFPPGMGMFNPDKKIDEFRNNPEPEFPNKSFQSLRVPSNTFYDPLQFTSQPIQRNDTFNKVPSGQNYSVSPLVQPVSRPVQQIKQPYFSPQTNTRQLSNNLNQMSGLGRQIQVGKTQKRSSLQGQKIEEIMSTIENLKINPISLLNEISTKIKKKVDYIMLETPIGKIRV